MLLRSMHADFLLWRLFLFLQGPAGLQPPGRDILGPPPNALEAPAHGYSPRQNVAGHGPSSGKGSCSSARLEDLIMWEMEKIKETRRGRGELTGNLQDRRRGGSDSGTFPGGKFLEECTSGGTGSLAVIRGHEILDLPWFKK